MVDMLIFLAGCSADMNLYCRGAIRVNGVWQVFGGALIVRAKKGLNNDVIQTSRIVIRETFLVDTVDEPRARLPLAENPTMRTLRNSGLGKSQRSSPHRNLSFPLFRKKPCGRHPGAGERR